MSGPRLSFNAETARSAVEQAEWNMRKWVWVPDVREGYVAGYVHSEDEDSAEVVLDSGRQVRRVPFDELFKMNPPKFDRVEDIADLTFLNEASVVHNLRLRYGSGAIYTYSGLFLVAINPYQGLPLYSDAIIQQYRGKRRDENPPHIFAVAERAWVNMGDERENQSILITGESGAGKTESTKKVIQYLAAIAADVHLPPSTPKSSTHVSSLSSSFLRRTTSRRGHVLSPSITGSSHNLNARGRLGLLERQILQANPILEAFGNAQTQRNNNSSRFGKFVRITFSPDGSIAGANIDWYLLEKSRVVYRNESERSFHVFYQLLSGGSDDLKDKLLLEGDIAYYEFLNKSRREIDGIDDKEEWNILHGALETVGFDSNEQFDLFRVVAAILHIGNIVITSSRSDDAVMPDPSQAERVCHLLGIPIADFTRAVLRPRALAGREWVTQARTRQQALDELCALCKTLYEKSFGALVERINRALDRPSSRSTFIGVLDIAGFEIFDVNGYEQLLINYTNERLQQFFNHHMFVLEQEEYARESIYWDYVNFGLDLQPTIHLIEASGNVIGVLSCLDEECIMPKADDKTFTNKLNAIWASNATDDENSHPGKAKYEPSRFEQGFIIQHYAAKVEYRTDGWLEKNKDPLNDDLSRVLAASTERCVAGLFSDHLDTTHSGRGTTVRKRTIKKGAFRTVAQRHKEQLASLMAQLKSTQPHFVRCIVPNALKKPGRMDVPLVLDQLRCNGVLEGIRIARLGYPNRLPFVEFRQRYEILTPGILPQGYMDGREACRRMVHTLDLDESIFKLGTSKIFFKAGVLAELEERRDAILFDIFSRIQAAARMWAARRQMRKILHRAVAVRVIQRNARVYGELREWPWWQLYTKVRPLLAATRNDEELRKKEMELALVRERAERDKQEREALEKLQMTLEAEKRKVEDELEAERVLTLDKDALLERSKQREADLEEEVIALQSDVNTLDSQVHRAMVLQKESEEKYEKLREALDQAADHLVRLEQEIRLRDGRALELKARLKETTDEVASLHSDRDQLRKTSDQTADQLLRLEQELQLRDDRELGLKEQLKKTTDVVDGLHSDLDQLRKGSDHAADQLLRLEQELRLRDERELGLKEQLKKTTNEVDGLHSDLGQLRKVSQNLEGIISQREESLARAKEREGELAEALQAKESLERQLLATLDEYRAFKDMASEYQQERDARLRDLQSVQGQLETETAKRTQLEKRVVGQKAELSKLKEDNSKLTKDLMKALKDLSDREWDVKQLESKQDKTIVEHVHVLEEAKRMTDKELVRAQTELEKKDVIIRSLQTTKSKMQGEAEDLALKYIRELRSKEQEVRDCEKRVSEAIVNLDKERRTREEAELNIHRVQTELQQARQQAEECSERLVAAERSRNALEDELGRLVEETEGATSFAQMQREYDTRLRDLESRLDERGKYARLEESRKALATQGELEVQYTKMQDIMKSKQVLQQEVVRLKEEQEVLKIEAENAKQQVQKLVREDEITRSTSAATQSELRTIIETLRANEQILQNRYETTEMERVNAASAEHKAVRQLAEIEATSKKATEDHKKSLRSAERRIKDLENQIERNRPPSSETGFPQKRIAEELEADRERHRKDLAERDLKIDQTRTKHQVKLAELNEELQSQRELLNHNREENRKLKSELTNLQVLHDDELGKSTGWRKERERLETKIVDLEKACAASNGAQTEQQSQIVSLHSQVHELRSVLDEAEMERALLQKARRALQAELETISIDHSESKTPGDQEYQKLQLQKQDLERLADEQEDRISYANEKVKKAESSASNCQIELGKLRVENSKLDKVNAKLEKKIQELGVHIKDLETRPFPKSTHGRQGDGKVAELTTQLQRANKDTRGRRSNSTELGNGKRNTP